MKTKAELQQNILNIAMKIQMEFPELSDHIKEMPSLFLTKDLDHKHTETLELYYSKLKSVLNEYSSKSLNLATNNEKDSLKISNFKLYSSPIDVHTNRKVESTSILGDHSKGRQEIKEIILSNKVDFRII